MTTLLIKCQGNYTKCLYNSLDVHVQHGHSSTRTTGLYEAESRAEETFFHFFNNCITKWTLGACNIWELQLLAASS